MKKRILILLAIMPVLVMAQEKKSFSIAGSLGRTSTPSMNKANDAGYYSLDFDYRISKKHILSILYFNGSNRYFDNSFLNGGAIRVSDGTNANYDYSVFGLLYKYQFFQKKIIRMQAGIGIGVLQDLRTLEVRSTNGAYYTNAGSNNDDHVIPIKLEFDLKLNKQFSIGSTTGFMFHPEKDWLGLHAGIRLSYFLN